MSTLSDFNDALMSYGAAIKRLVTAKPAEALTTDDASALEGTGRNSFIITAQNKLTNHQNDKVNPHNTTADAVGGVNKSYVDLGLQGSVPGFNVPISQFGDTGSASLGITSTGFVLNFAQPITSYLLGVYKVLPSTSINLTTVTASPGGKTFYVYLISTNGNADYSVSLSKLPESESTMYIGSVVTGSTAITAINIVRVSRLGVKRISASPQGSGIPTTTGNPTTAAKLNVAWKP